MEIVLNHSYQIFAAMDIQVMDLEIVFLSQLLLHMFLLFYYVQKDIIVMEMEIVFNQMLFLLVKRDSKLMVKEDVFQLITSVLQFQCLVAQMAKYQMETEDVFQQE